MSRALSIRSLSRSSVGKMLMIVLVVGSCYGGNSSSEAAEPAEGSKASASGPAIVEPAVTAKSPSPPVDEKKTPDGQKIYKAQCASCHGAAGEGGTADYPNPLIGDRSVLELAKLIAKTMPEDDPGSCTGDDAHAVATYIYDSFYSPTAQARIRPARVELSRLTVRQFQNSLADLVGELRGPTVWGEQRGLKGQYYNSRRFNNKERLIERIDPTVKFDFGEVGPGPEPEKFKPHEFSIRWEGSVLAPESGDYEFIVHTEHAARLWVNDDRTPLIDAWVKSGDDTEYRGSIRLLGGRVYPIKLEFSKAKQGVDDKNKRKSEFKSLTATVKLEWKLPHRSAEVIPQRALSPQTSPEVFVVQSQFPPDDRSNGYERGTSISKAWDQATTDAAIEFTAYITSRLDQLAKAPSTGPEREAKLREFCHRLVEKAFRRPLSDEQKRQYVDSHFDKARDVDASQAADIAVKRVLLLMLKSPRFLYREFGAVAAKSDAGSKSNDPYDVASRLAFGMWDSLPDAELLKAAAAGELSSREQVLRQADRMSKDLRARAKLREFFVQWLRVDQSHDLAKDSKQYPEFTPQLASDLRTSLDLFVEQVIWSEGSDFRQLLLADELPVNGRMAQFLQVDLPDDADFESLAIDPNQRSGVLSHPYLLAAFAYTGTSSPIHRGVFISRSLLGRVLRPPPEAVTPLAPELHANLTTRQRIAMQTESESCMSCHGMINPLGFTLENFDAVGRFRSEEQGKPIDVAGGYLTRQGKEVKFSGVRELAAFLAESDETHTALVEQLFHNMIKQPIRAYGPDLSERLRQSFRDNQFHVRKLMIDVVVSAALP